MFQAIEIIQERESGLDRQVWTFRLRERPQYLHLMLTNYEEQRRASKRHRYRTIRYYDLHARRNDREVMSIEDVPLPDSVAIKAKNLLISRIIVGDERGTQ